jgi:2-C-methyl-D-erythritol 4-phosphate cytidylyltransferase
VVVLPFRWEKLFWKKQSPSNFCSAVVAAAGSSRRMGGEDKMMLPLRGVPVLAHSLVALDSCPDISEIIIVTRQELIPSAGEICREYGIHKAKKIIAGGEKRHISVLLGAQEADPRAQLIAVHDGARPLVGAHVITAAVRAAAEHGAAAPAVPVKDTIKAAKSGIVFDTPPRETLFAVQTPQVFQAQLLTAALKQAAQNGEAPTDDCAAVERLGMKILLTEGSYENIKITTPEDLAIAEAILAFREDRI